MHEIVNADLHDKEYVAAHTVGFEQLAERLQEWPPGRVAKITGIPADRIRELARDYAATRPAAIRVNYGLQRHYGGGMAMRNITCLPALIGAWREQGGGIQLSTSGPLRQLEPTGRPPADFPGVDENGKPAHLFAHPTAGGACVGARRVLLAWNVDVEGVSLEEAGKVASGIRESGGGFRGLRALALFLPGQGRTQISMSLETPDETGPMEVFAAIESGVERLGGRVVGTEVVGMAPDAITSVVAGAMAIRDWSTDRILSRRVAAYVGTDPMA